MKSKLVGLFSVLGIVVLLVGVPLFLTLVAQPYLPSSLPTANQVMQALTSPDNGTVVVVLLWVVAWAAWAYLAIAILVELWAALRRVPAPRLPGFGLPQGIAKSLVAGALLLAVSTPGLASAAPNPSPVDTKPAAPAATATIAPETRSAESSSASAQQQTFINHTVGPRDTLSGLAKKYLGDADRYPEIFEVNKGMVQSNGRRLTNPDLIVDGTVLRIPQYAATPSSTLPASTASTAKEDTTTASVSDLRAAVEKQEPAASTATNQKDVEHKAPKRPIGLPSSSAADQYVASVEVTPAAEQAQQVEAVDPVITVDAEDEADQAPAVTPFGAGIALSAGIISLIGGYRIAQRRKRLRGAALAMPTGAAVLVEQQLRQVNNSLAIEDVDKALRALSQHCTDTGQELPEIYIARLSASSFELYLREPRQLPAPWTGVADQTLWALYPDQAAALADRDFSAFPAPYPGLVTIGQDVEGSHVLVDLEAIGELSIAADTQASEEILAALAVELATSCWADDLTVTLVGAFPEMEDVLKTGRINYVPTVGRLFEDLQSRADSDRVAMAQAQVDDLHQARLEATVPSTWYPEIVLLAHPLTQKQSDQLDQLLTALPHVAVAAVSVADKDITWRLETRDEDALLHPTNLTITPQRLPAEPYKSILEIATVAQTGQEVNNQVTAQAVDELVTEATAWLQTQTTPATAAEITLTDLPVPLPAAPETTDKDTETASEQEQDTTAETTPAVDEPGTAEDDVTLVYGPQEDQPYLQLLGHIDLVGAPGPVEQKRQARMIEYLAYLMLNPGSAIEAIDEAIWPNRKNPENSPTRNSVTSRLRKWLGTQDNGQPRVEMNTYTITDVGCDWFDFCRLINGKALEDLPDARLEAAISLVRGSVLKGAGIRYWAWAEPIRQEMISTVVDACYELAVRQMANEDWLACEATLAKALDIEPGDEQFWRMRILAAHARHNQQAVQEATDRLFAQLEAFDTAPGPVTDTFLRALKDGASITDLMEMF